MFRLVVSKVPSGARFKRFWVPSLDRIGAFADAVRLKGSEPSAVEAERVAGLIRHVRIGGTNKSTAPARLGAADQALLAHLKCLPGQALHFLDVGCSEGTTSLDTIEKLERRTGGPVTAYLMDRYIWVRRLRRGPVVEYLSGDGGLVMARCGAIALAPVPGTFLLAPVTNRVVAAYLALGSFRQGMRETGKIPLLSPRVLARPDLDICEGSVLTLNERLVNRMDAVRVSNLLHSDYFSEQELRTGLAVVARYVRDGGLLLVSRNDEQDGGEIERGTVWRRTGSTLVPVADFGGGSEVRALVASMEPPCAC